MEATTSDCQIPNENFHSQNVSTEFSTPRNSSALQINSTSQSTTDDTTIQQSEQRKYVRNCNCGLEPILREAKANTPNKGRFFWSCRRFGGPNHLRRCNFFRWDSSPTQNASSTALNTPEMLHVLIESMGTSSFLSNTNTNNHDDDNNNDYNDDVNNGEVNLSPLSDQLTRNEVVMPRSIAHTRVATTTITPHQRVSLQAPSNTVNRTITAAGTDDTHSITGDIYNRRPAIFSNWENVPKYSTPQLLDIVQNHLVQQDKNYQQWYNATQIAKQDLEEARKEVEKLMRELDIANRENDLCKREHDVLKAEKRLLKFENDELKKENQELKRRH
ncbi:hypothetical protein C1645_838518 [Glomus cerebriforme]|uniref:GRF-type domain-containing protein n=1 Tax=Glomus cerebriforme TaxID=658196 RepID=A0A397S4Y5_9GLOM|nr:hypothetical protein C1645_838518 [Glomus cerebriforme]